MATDIDWRKKELGIKEVIAKYDDVSPFAIIKADAQRRGVKYTDAALKLVDPTIHQVQSRLFCAESSEESKVPFSFLLRDGSSVITNESMVMPLRDPLIIDEKDGKAVIVDEDEVLEEVFFWEKPQFYDKTTSSGKPMWHIAWARPQRIDLNPFQNCQFWDSSGDGCKFCAIASTYKKNEKPQFVDIEDIDETLEAAFSQEGRFSALFLTGGSILSGKELLDDEVDNYIKILKCAGKYFKTERFPSQLIGTAFNKRQLKRLHDETGLMSYTADIEVLDGRLFDWISPGKSKRIGYEGWKQRLYDAVEIFGRGYVDTGLVAGVEFAKPKGFESEDEALENVLDEAEELARHGVSTVGCVWNVHPGSVFRTQKTPSLEYYVRLAKGLDDIRRRHGLDIHFDDYRRCGNHPDSDLSRI